MYLHIGNDLILKRKEILFILDYENLINNKSSNQFFNKIDKKDIIDISRRKTKIYYNNKRKRNNKRIYIKHISYNTRKQKYWLFKINILL